MSNDSSEPVEESAVKVFDSTVIRGFDEKSSPASGIPSTHVIRVVTLVPKLVGGFEP